MKGSLKSFFGLFTLLRALITFLFGYMFYELGNYLTSLAPADNRDKANAAIWAAIALLILYLIKDWYKTLPTKPYTVGIPQVFGIRLRGYVEGWVFLPFPDLLFRIQPIEVETRPFDFTFEDVLLDNSQDGNTGQQAGGAPTEMGSIGVIASGKIRPDLDHLIEYSEIKDFDKLLSQFLGKFIRQVALDPSKEPHNYREVASHADKFLSELVCEALHANADEAEKLKEGTAEILLKVVWCYLEQLAIAPRLPEEISKQQTRNEANRLEREDRKADTLNVSDQLEELKKHNITGSEGLRHLELAAGLIEPEIIDVGPALADAIKSSQLNTLVFGAPLLGEGSRGQGQSQSKGKKGQKGGQK